MRYSISDGFPYYIELLGDRDYIQLFNSKEHVNLLKALTDEQAAFRYAPGKWSIKQIIGHITDHERIMTYRALRFSRKDKTPLPGYDQDTFVDNSRFDELPVSQLVTDLENVRNASVSFINSLSQTQLALTGTAWKYELTVESFLKATIGHELHHMNVLKHLYSPALP
ncbi:MULTISPECIES: DinB family protein [Niastella]|uniref:DinB family protein n=1 Tax=Niastella soli TaxID=2821487 RepID=A0ABS3Z671_9BACT|nr:DinB family protein [Niastella soli]MBO9205180.1 DinB family protein [Niastella soli]